MDKKKLGILIGLLAYVIFAFFIAIKIPDIMSGGNQNVKTILTTGQTAAISSVSIPLDQYSGDSSFLSKLKVGSTLYITRQSNSAAGQVIDISTKNNGQYFKVVVNSFNGNTISGVREIFQNDIQLGAVISLSNSDEIILKTIEVDGSEEPYHRILADFQYGEVSFPDGKVSSNGYKTIDRTNIGLLVNDGSVGLAMTDSDIDGLFQQVFQTVIG